MFSKLMTASTCLLALGGVAVAGDQHLKPRSMLTCNSNNCLRAYDHSMTDALPFCSTFIQSTATVVVTPTATISGTSTITAISTVYPTIPPATIPAHLSSRCVDSDADATPLPVRMSSACSCISAPVSTVTTTIAAPTATTTVMAIDAFVYGSTVQTTTAQQNLISADGQTITINTNALVPPFSYAGDFPQPRSLSMLYQYANDMRIWAAVENSGIYTLVPGALSLSSPGVQEIFSYTAPPGARITILAVVWGPAVINNGDVYQALYDDAAASQPFCFENSFFELDPWYGVVKTGAVYYLDSNGVLQVAVGVEHSCVSFA